MLGSTTKQSVAYLDMSCLLGDIGIVEVSRHDPIRDDSARLINWRGSVGVGSARRFVHYEADAFVDTDCNC